MYHHESETHFFTQIPQPMHSSSEMNAFLSVGLTSMHSLPILTTGHDRLHSCLHFFGLHWNSQYSLWSDSAPTLSSETMATRVSLSAMAAIYAIRLSVGALKIPWRSYSGESKESSRLVNVEQKTERNI